MIIIITCQNRKFLLKVYIKDIEELVAVRITNHPNTKDCYVGKFTVSLLHRTKAFRIIITMVEKQINFMRSLTNLQL